MKFHFQFDIAGAKKSTSEGCTKIWDGAKMNIDIEAEVSEMVQAMKDKQISLDKIISFVRSDLPNSIRQCGGAFIDVERENRKMNAEIPSNGMKSLIEENKKLREHIEELNNTNNDLHNSWDQEHDLYMDEHLNKLAAREQVEKLKKELEEKTLQFNSLKADMEGTMESFREMENNYNDLKSRVEKEKMKRQWSETIA